MDEIARNPVGWFEIPAVDLPRARAFYEAVFGYAFEPGEVLGQEMLFFPMSMSGPGAGGALVKADGYAPSAKGGVVIYFSADDINRVLARAEQHGGRVVLPKTSIGPYGFCAHLADTEGNTVGLHARA